MPEFRVWYEGREIDGGLKEALVAQDLEHLEHFVAILARLLLVSDRRRVTMRVDEVVGTARFDARRALPDPNPGRSTGTGCAAQSGQVGCGGQERPPSGSADAMLCTTSSGTGQ